MVDRLVCGLADVLGSYSSLGMGELGAPFSLPTATRALLGCCRTISEHISLDKENRVSNLGSFMVSWEVRVMMNALGKVGDLRTHGFRELMRRLNRIHCGRCKEELRKVVGPPRLSRLVKLSW